jgi:hypothetical protein
MVTRIRRDRSSLSTTKVEELMKSISESSEEAARLTAKVKTATAELYALMHAMKLAEYTCGPLIAEVYRPAGRATNIVDPKAFRKMVTNDSDFYAAVNVSVTSARKVLPEKLLATITTTVPAKPGEETVRVSRVKA